MKRNMFLFVTKSGIVYNRTSGRNVRLSFGVKYEIGSDFVEFVNDGSRVIVNYITMDMGVKYSKDITESGMYMVTPIFTQPIAKTEKEIRILYNKLKSILNKPSFKIVEDERIEDPYKIILHVNKKNGLYESRFTIKVKKDALNIDVTNEIFIIMEAASEINYRLVFKHFNMNSQQGMSVTINTEFLNMVKIIEKLQRESLSAI